MKKLEEGTRKPFRIGKCGPKQNTRKIELQNCKTHGYRVSPVDCINLNNSGECPESCQVWMYAPDIAEAAEKRRKKHLADREAAQREEFPEKIQVEGVWLQPVKGKRKDSAVLLLDDDGTMRGRVCTVCSTPKLMKDFYANYATCAVCSRVKCLEYNKMARGKRKNAERKNEK